MTRLWRLLPFLVPAALAAQQQIPVTTVVQTRPDTVRVGDPFTVVVAVRAPRGATIEFPEPPDSSATVQALDPRSITAGPGDDSTSVTQQAAYRVAAWDIGKQPVLRGEVVVKLGARERRIALGSYSVFVATVLPEDTTLHVPKPARELFQRLYVPWWVYALIAAAFILGTWLWYWWTHRQTRRAIVVVDPYERAIRELARIDALGLVDAGERGRHVALTVDVLREYLSARFPSAPMSTTSTELLAAVRGQSTVLQERLLRTLNEADLVKFARRAVSADRAREMGREVRFIIDHEHKASQPPDAAAGEEKRAA